METEMPCCAAPTPSEATSLPCSAQTLPFLIQIHAAPTLLLSADPPTMAMLPSAETATEMPCWAAPTAPVPNNLDCCVNCAKAGRKDRSSAHTITVSAL